MKRFLQLLVCMIWTAMIIALWLNFVPSECLVSRETGPPAGLVWLPVTNHSWSVILLRVMVAAAIFSAPISLWTLIFKGPRGIRDFLIVVISGVINVVCTVWVALVLQNSLCSTPISVALFAICGVVFTVVSAAGFVHQRRQHLQHN